ncbi:hypothetical protein [Bradyrhizobium sp. CCBAU 51627]|uniref:hypothetical protein n=1 Tax=Bradyrhizobium sp. CCBAU 51627 TaxID=1325088 RepID=UPI002304D3D0|nr:hypothetical protein [Bradyrhizobium sp. CCBAU 51627]
MAFTSHLDRIDAEQRANPANEPVDDVAVIDLYGSRDAACACVRPRADGSQPKSRDTSLIEQAAKCGVHIAGLEFEQKHQKHRRCLVLLAYRTGKGQDCCSSNLGVA